eukprot:TRINITY_DN1094_c2_g1_i1.p1 TRINITY_DN1094_c2_g1~~TRINITY_DN1094_c2_g1_i1.p1  ORF type:complete len:203 (+),score=51.72 TRINITY_DN1094_c2_g1_i1:53-661(+)
MQIADTITSALRHQKEIEKEMEGRMEGKCCNRMRYLDLFGAEHQGNVASGFDLVKKFVEEEGKGERTRPTRHELKSRCCEHNSWDNVRVCKKVMTLRCRVCQKQWRTPVDSVWELKCDAFGAGKCPEGDSCLRMHIHYRKQTLEERVRSHGTEVLHHVRSSRLKTDSAPTTPTTPQKHHQQYYQFASPDHQAPPVYVYMRHD